MYPFITTLNICKIKVGNPIFSKYPLRDSNSYTEVPDPKSGVSTNSTKGAYPQAHHSCGSDYAILKRIFFNPLKRDISQSSKPTDYLSFTTL